MKIIHLTTSDPAGAIINQCQAINKHTDSEARLICINDLGYGWDSDILLDENNLYGCEQFGQVPDLIKEFDLTVLHKPVELNAISEKLLADVLEWSKNVAIYHHGEPSLRAEAAKVIQFEDTIASCLKIVVTPDLLKLVPNSVFLPNCYNEDAISKYMPSENDDIDCDVLITQCWTGVGEKDIDFVVEELTGLVNCSYSLIKQVPFHKCLEKKAKSDIACGLSESGAQTGVEKVENYSFLGFFIFSRFCFQLAVL